MVLVEGIQFVKQKIRYISDYGVEVPLSISNLHDISKDELCGGKITF
ncbi:MAG: hypothetical protein LUB59_02505 [Candidatus Gastranaerophilales bacterium]|nr:hypothetical protein [Candidatus Gastranaerophilales bacterium]